MINILHLSRQDRLASQIFRFAPSCSTPAKVFLVAEYFRNVGMRRLHFTRNDRLDLLDSNFVL